VHRSNVHVKLYKLPPSYVSPSPGPDCTITPSLSLSMSNHDVSPENLSVSSSSVTIAVKVVGMADMLGSAEGDGLIDGVSEVLGEDVKSVSQIKMEMELSLPKLPSILPSVCCTLLLVDVNSAYPASKKPSPHNPVPKKPHPYAL